MCHGTARALRSLETPLPKRDLNRCAATRTSSQAKAHGAAPVGWAAGVRREQREPVAGAPRGGGRWPRCKTRTTGPKPFCPVQRARVPPRPGRRRAAASAASAQSPRAPETRRPPGSCAAPLPIGGGLSYRSRARRRGQAAAAPPTAPPAPHHHCYRPPHPPDTALRGEAGGGTCAWGRGRGPSPFQAVPSAGSS